jgi:hypothetical protein
MNRQQRRAAAKSPTSPQESVGTPQQNAGIAGSPSLALRLISRLLLSAWVLRRVHHPDLLGLLLQVAQQVGRTDAVVQLTTKLYSSQR